MENIDRRQMLQRGLALGFTIGGAGLGGAARAASGVTLTATGEALPPFEGIANLARNYTKETGVKIVVEPYAYETTIQKAMLDFTAGTGNYDFIMGIGWEAARYVANDYLVPLEDHLNAKTYPIDLNDILPSVLNAGCRFEGGLYGLPCTAQAMYFWYRKDLFENEEERAGFKQKYGYELPIPTAEDPITYDQYRDLAEFFTRSAGNELAGEKLKSNFYGTLLQGKRHGAVVFEFSNYLYSWGGSILNEKDEVTINSPEALEALKFYIGMLEFSPPGSKSYTFDDALVVMQQGKVAMCIMWFDAAPAVEDPKRSRVAGKMAFGPNPKHVRNAHTYGGWTWYVNKQGKNIDKAIEFIRYTNTQKAAMEWLDYGGLPSRPDVLNSEKYKSIGMNVGREVALNNIVLYPIHKLWCSDMLDLLSVPLSLALAKELTAEEALKQMEDTVVKLRGS